jgi:Predicted periplasmic lipoprotein (DUF2279)
LGRQPYFYCMVVGIIILLSVLFLWLAIGSSAATQLQNRITGADKTRALWLNATLITLIYLLCMVSVNRLWYASMPQNAWHWFNDIPEWMQMDKLGHFYATFSIGRIIMHALKNRGIIIMQAATIGCLAGFLMVTPIEFFDGYAMAYGASWADALANFSGALFLWLQIVFFNRVVVFPKYSFHTTAFAALRPNVLGNNWYTSFLKDYNGQTYWFNIPVNNLLPPGAQHAPAWLNLSIGYGAEAMVYGREAENLTKGYHPYRQYYLSLNIDLRKTAFFKKYAHHTMLRALVFWFEGMQLPAPCVEVNPNGFQWHLIYF